jgi:hypothetical protein
MNSNSNNTDNLFIDIESQDETYTLDTPLRGILKNTDRDTISEIIEVKIATICISLILLTVSLPIIICDLYFGFSGDICSMIKLENLFGLRIYLLVNGFIGIVSLSFILAMINIFQTRIDRHSYIYLYGITLYITIIISILSLVANIMTYITFWGYIYYNKLCDFSSSFVTYMIVSLICKTISTLCTICVIHKCIVQNSTID